MKTNKATQHHINWWIETEAFDVISDLMDIIEEELPELYYKSDRIARAQDILSYIEQHGEHIKERNRAHICEKNNCTNTTESTHAYCRECIYKMNGK